MIEIIIVQNLSGVFYFSVCKTWKVVGMNQNKVTNFGFLNLHYLFQMPCFLLHHLKTWSGLLNHHAFRPRLAAPIIRDNYVKFWAHITGDHRVITFVNFAFGTLRHIAFFITLDDASQITQAISKIQVRTWIWRHMGNSHHTSPSHSTCQTLNYSHQGWLVQEEDLPTPINHKEEVPKGQLLIANQLSPLIRLQATLLQLRWTLQEIKLIPKLQPMQPLGRLQGIQKTYNQNQINLGSCLQMKKTWTSKTQMEPTSWSGRLQWKRALLSCMSKQSRRVKEERPVLNPRSIVGSAWSSSRNFLVWNLRIRRSSPSWIRLVSPISTWPTWLMRWPPSLP